MLEIKCFDFGPFATNTYVVSDEQHILLVDPACSNQYEQQALCNYINSLVNQSVCSPVILATHSHLDHLWGAAWATEQWQTPVLMHEADIPMAKAMQDQYTLFGVRATAQPFPVEPLNTSTIPSGIQILHTPGHTPGSVCLYWPEEKTLLSGDTLFRMGYGRTDLPGGNMAQLISSLDQLFTLPPDVKVYPGHGDFTTIGAEKR
ncbi:MAG: MBL fold metallo-hydrolase [Paludibacteraceae bacterium]|nr:MBL fold metallo-hydrolase [Paludibacteraceae bacterium]